MRSINLIRPTLYDINRAKATTYIPYLLRALLLRSKDMKVAGPSVPLIREQISLP